MRDQVPQFEQVVRDLDSHMRQFINSTFLVPSPPPKPIVVNDVRIDFRDLSNQYRVSGPRLSFYADFCTNVTQLGPTGVVVQTPVNEWLRWLETLSRFI
jgi:hypothetical protein